ncbi:MAG: DNA cytosine methyltransferase [Candidatus Aminicenantes bacterium]|nr:DNA cytosine methyltransferase [Candidatus Aminicenantes bacterium]
MSKLTVIDFFCGAGGFSEGFRQQGFEIVAGIDSWKPAIDSFNFNFGLECKPHNVLEFETSIKQIGELPDTDVIIGSPPCVSFSNSNKSGKADKSFGLKLTKIFLRVVAVKKHKPNSKLKAWFMENVSNSTNHLPKQYRFEQLGLKKWALEQGLDPKTIAISLEENRSVINSADLGVPQSRTRVFTGEIIEKKKHVIPERTHRAPQDEASLPTHITLGQVRQQLPKPSDSKSEEYISDPLYPSIWIKQAELVDQFYDTGLYACGWKGSKFLKTNHPYMGPMSFPEREDRPSRTITATKIGNSREAIIFRSEYARKGDGEYRTATIREAATLMGFPITFQFIGSEGNKWKLVGNAVCPPVSRAFARAVRKEYGFEKITEPQVINALAALDRVPNLNTFEQKHFDNPPRRNNGSRFRRHPFKHGNLTVTLSNYDIKKNGKNRGKWKTSIQYGTGEGYDFQTFSDGYYKKLKPLILEFEGGPTFIDVISNVFSEKVARSELLQEMYETQHSNGKYIEPVELVDSVAEIIDTIVTEESNFDQNGQRLFKKKSIPKKQVMALYVINKICSIANGEKR